MIDQVKPRQKIPLPTQTNNPKVLEDVARRYERTQQYAQTPGILERGLRGSSTGIALGQGFNLQEQQNIDQYKEQNPNWMRDGVETLINMAASLPVFVAGTAAGTAIGGPVIGAAGGFGVDTAVRASWQQYLESVKRGDTSLSFEDYAEIAKETGKSAALGGVLSAASPFLKLATNNAAVSKLLRTPITKGAAEQLLEAGAFTVGGAAIGHGDLSFESFRDNLIAVGGMHLSQKAVQSLFKKHQETGKSAERLLIEYKPSAKETPITEHQKAESERITKEQKELRQKEKEAKARENAGPRTEPSLKEKFEGGLKEIARAEQERLELDKIEKGIQELERPERESKEKEDRKFQQELKQDIQERIDGLKKRQEDLTGKEQSDLYKQAQKLRKRIEDAKFHRERSAVESEYAKKGMLAKQLEGRMEGLLKKKERIQKKATFESPKQMQKPLQERLTETLTEKRADVKRLYTRLNESLKAKEPKAIKESIRKEIRETEQLVNELERAESKSSSKKSADKIAESIMEKAERSTERGEFNKAIEKDLAAMGIKIRCL